MAYISIVVPVYLVQGYLRACLDSILAQSFTDIEVIAIDDHSPDHCPEILDEYAAADPRVRVLHLEENIGLGPARNVGLAHACGEYVWFVDSDDWLAPGSLRAIAAKLRQTSPEVLLVDHTRVSWLGREHRSDGRELLATADTPHCTNLAEQPGFLRLFTVAWNKIVRRDFLDRTGIDFDPGWYEDLPFTYPILVAADQIATLGRVCYHYRRRRATGITQTRSKRHFEVFDQWSTVFERLDALGSRAAPFRDAIFERMMWHLLLVQARPDRLPPETHREFFRRMSEYYRRYRPAEQAALRPVDRVRRLLIAADAYRLFRGLRAVRLTLEGRQRGAQAIWRQSRATIQRGRSKAVTAMGRMYYWLHRTRPIEVDLAVYAAYWYRGFACNPAAIYTTARTLAPAVRGVWVVDREHAATMPESVPYVIAGTPRYYRMLARARWLINNVNFPDFVVKRPGSVHLQTHHGTPIKVMGTEQAHYPISSRGLNVTQMMTRSDRWDFSLSSNAHSTEVWSRAYPCQYETLEYGYPRNDRLALADPTEAAAARRDLDIAAECVVVLYAPTHRDYAAGYQPLLDVEGFADALGPEFLVLVRAHYFYGSPARPPTHPRVRDVSAHPCVEDVLLASDILVTDYSSVMFDFAVLDRPIVVYAPDWDTYRRTRGVTFDLLAAAPGAVATTEADLIDAFGTGIVSDDAATKARAQFRTRFCGLDDGRAAQRVIHRLFAEYVVDSAP